MACYRADGFEDYPDAQLTREYVRLADGDGCVCGIVAGGRNGGNRLRCAFGGHSGVVVPLPAGLATVVWGDYLEITNLTTAVWLYDVRDATVSHVLVRANSDGSIAAYRGGNNTDFGAGGGSATLLGVSAAGVVQANVPFQMQTSVTVDPAAGAVTIKVNGTSVLTLAGQNTQNSGTAFITNVIVGAYDHNNPGYVYHDDLYFADAFLGDQRVDSHYLTGDGAHGDGTPSTPGDHYLMADEASPDDDATYVTLAVAGDRESYAHEAFKNSGAPITAVILVADVRKTDAGGAQWAPGFTEPGSPAGDYDGVAVGITVDWGRYQQVFDVDPATSAAWDETDFNGRELMGRKAA